MSSFLHTDKKVVSSERKVIVPPIIIMSNKFWHLLSIFPSDSWTSPANFDSSIKIFDSKISWNWTPKIVEP